MKNIHLSPTDKPSFGKYLVFNKENKICIWDTEAIGGQKTLTPHHIYITCDKEPKEDDWCFGMDGIFQYKGKVNLPDVELPKKIILTTDPNLIKDGVQAIDDTFLEWFVKNPSCEFVEVEKTFVTNSGLGYQEYAVLNSDFKVLEVVATRPQSSYKIGSVTKLDDYEYVTEYKIIIPQEEPKQECTCGVCDNCEEQETIQILKEAKENALKQETLEEAAEKYTVSVNAKMGSYKGAYENCSRLDFIAGAKWQAERMYNSLSELRNELYDKLPTGDVDAFELLKVIKNHLQKLDELI